MEFVLNLHPYEKRYSKRYLVLYHAFRAAIRAGQFRQGDKLPSSRQLAKRYNVSRSTATLVYEMLWSDGYVTSQQGSGTYVAFQTADTKLPPASASIHFSEWAQRLTPRPTDPLFQACPYNFSCALSGYDAFPQKEWGWSMRQASSQLDYLLQPRHYPPAGLVPLREAIASHLNRARGMTVSANDIVVVNGSIQALALLLQILINPGDEVVLENPCFRGSKNAIQVLDGNVLAADVDEQGIRIEDWNSPVVLVTPGHQFPSGVVLERKRRLALLDWAVRHQSVIIEDDYDSDFRRKGRPIEPLKVLDTQNRVVYVGTFSTTLNRMIRLGYVVLPPEMKTKFLEAKQVYETGTSAILEQMTVALFMKHGYYERSLRKISRLYAQKYQSLKHLIDHYLPGAFAWTDSEVGTHLFGWWQQSPEKLSLLETSCQKRGVCWDNPASYFVERPRPGAFFGISYLPSDQMEPAVKIMGEVFASLSA